MNKKIICTMTAVLTIAVCSCLYLSQSNKGCKVTNETQVEKVTSNDIDSKETLEIKEQPKKEESQKKESKNKQDNTDAVKEEKIDLVKNTQNKTINASKKVEATTKNNTGSTNAKVEELKKSTTNENTSKHTNTIVVEDDPDSYLEFNDGGNYALGGSFTAPDDWYDPVTGEWK